MAETESKESNDPIHCVASMGENLSVSLVKFASKWDSGQQYIADVAVAASTITTLLLDVTRTIAQYNEDWLEENAIHVVCEGIKVDFEKIARALEMANYKAGPGRFVAQRSKKYAAAKNPGMTDQSFLNKRLNGVALLKAEVESDPLVFDRLEEAKGRLWYLYEGCRYLTLRKLQTEERLQRDEAKELERLIEQLPTVVAELGYHKHFILEDAERLKAVQAQAYQNEVHENGNWPASDFRYSYGMNDGLMARRNVDDDIQSIASFNSVASFQFLGIDEVYEAWVIRKFEGEKNWPRRSWSLGWFTVYEYVNNSGYEIEPQPMTIEQMKEQSEVVKTGEFKPEQTALIEKTMATIPPGVQQEIKMIVEDRVLASTNPRYPRKWKIVDIIIKSPKVEPTPIWMMLFQSQPAFSEALFIIKGETAGPNDVSRPLRDQDPFRKPQYRRCRGHRADPRDVVVERRPQRRATETNQARRRSTAQMIGDRITDVPKTLDLEEAESMIKYIMAEIAGLYSERERLDSDEVMVRSTSESRVSTGLV